jgi:hypothetical protein
MPATVHVFDPALCCPTGVCGPSVDPQLARFAADLAWLAERGAAVERFNLAQQPAAFAQNELVRAALAERGEASLPMVLVDGRVALSGIYPTREQLAALAGVTVEAAAPVAAPTGCTPKAGASGGKCC